MATVDAFDTTKYRCPAVLNHSVISNSTPPALSVELNLFQLLAWASKGQKSLWVVFSYLAAGEALWDTRGLLVGFTWIFRKRLHVWFRWIVTGCCVVINIRIKKCNLGLSRAQKLVGFGEEGFNCVIVNKNIHDTTSIFTLFYQNIIYNYKLWLNCF